MEPRAEVSPKAYPVAGGELSSEILSLVAEARKSKQLRKGANEAIKVLNRNAAEFIIIAADTDPIEIVLELPILCADKNVPYIFIPSRAALGKACQVTTCVTACAIKIREKSGLQPRIDSIKAKIEQAFVSKV